jgi:hypothetical protein
METNPEIQKIETEIQQLKDQIRNLFEKNGSEKEIDILEDELCEMKNRRECMIQLHNYQMSCNHVFIEDLIDLTPDKSKTIEYCVHCLFQK